MSQVPNSKPRPTLAMDVVPPVRTPATSLTCGRQVEAPHSQVTGLLPGPHTAGDTHPPSPARLSFPPSVLSPLLPPSPPAFFPFLPCPLPFPSFQRTHNAPRGCSASAGGHGSLTPAQPVRGPWDNENPRRGRLSPRKNEISQEPPQTHPASVLYPRNHVSPSIFFFSRFLVPT